MHANKVENLHDQLEQYVYEAQKQSPAIHIKRNVFILRLNYTRVVVFSGVIYIEKQVNYSIKINHNKI